MSVKLDLSTTVNGREWKLFGVSFSTADGEFSTYIYALSHEHASHIVQELRETARLDGQVCGVVKP